MGYLNFFIFDVSFRLVTVLPTGSSLQHLKY